MLTGTCHCGAVRWTFQSDPGSATACNCTICRRYGTLWIYGHADEDVLLTGPTSEYVRKDGGHLAFLFCAACGNAVAWKALTVGKASGRRRMAVNLRLADDPEAAMDLPIDHFDGLESFDDLPRDARRVRDMWF